MWFKVVSRLKIILEKKNELILVRWVENVDDLLIELGCRGSFLFGTSFGCSI